MLGLKDFLRAISQVSRLQGTEGRELELTTRLRFVFLEQTRPTVTEADIQKHIQFTNESGKLALHPLPRR